MRLHRHGHAHGLRRYRCVDCARTFNALTGTPLARLRHRTKWLPYLDCMLQSDTVRRAAVVVGVHKNTSFRWRHRFLTITKSDRSWPLEGITEADETYLLESQKGCATWSAHRAGVAGGPGGAGSPTSRCASWSRATAPAGPSTSSRGGRR